jgi:DNA polymerase III alpha subunit
MLANSESIEKVEESIDMLISILGKDNCYLEIIAQDEQKESKIKEINKCILGLSQKKNIPCVLSNIYFYPTKDDKVTQELALAIKDNLTIFDPNHRAPQTLNHMMEEDEIRMISKKN